MRPESIPPLEGKDAKKFLKEIQRPVSSRDYAVFRKAEKVYKSIKPAK